MVESSPAAGPVPPLPSASAAAGDVTDLSRGESRQFPCTQCGAALEFRPGADALVCSHCGSENPIVQDGEAAVEEEDYEAALSSLSSGAATIETSAHRCRSCGAETVFGAHLTADACAFCGSAIVGDVTSAAIAPKALLPFAIDREKARAAWARWLAGLWFAPNALRKAAGAEALQGCYLPYYTYDAETLTAYRGERGDDYWATEHYTATRNGRTEHRTRQVRRTRWHAASGRVQVAFDDILVLAGKSLPRALTEALEPWDLQALVPYDEQYLSGFQAQRAQVSLADGFATARSRMRGEISAAIRRDIGGDHQRIHHQSTQYRELTFKHVLLPLWISSYRYRERVFRFVINARSGEVQGERPWSVAKILTLVLGVIGAIALIVALVQAG